MRPTLIAFFVALGLGSQALAQEAPASEAEAPPAGQLTKPPELLQFIEAAYPKEAEEQKLAGAVGLLVDIDEKGAVAKVEVSEPAGHGFDEAAVAAVQQFKFSPAEIDGKPAAVRIAYRYHFTLRPESPERKETPAPVVTLRGTILQRGNRVPVAAEVSVDGGAFGATSDAQGRFEIAGLPPGKHAVVANAPGFERFETEEETVEGTLTEVTYYIRKRVFTPYETVVRGKRERKEVARVELQQEEIRLVPGTQGDAFKVVQNLPGVARSAYGFGTLVVRGGRPQDTRIYLDGIWVPLIYHFGGLTSVYNSDLLQDLTFQPGNFNARYGRATGGALEAQTRSPSRDGYHGYLNTNLIDTTALIEGPLGGNWSGAVAGRISYVDLILKAVMSGSDFVVAPRYWDYQAIAEWAPAQSKDRVRISGYGANDAMKLIFDNPAMIDPEGRSQIGASIGFHRLVGTWTHTWSPTARNALTVAFGLESSESALGSDIKSANDVWTLQLRDAFTWDARPWLSLEVGTDTYLGYVDTDLTMPTMPLPGEFPDPIISRQLIHARQNTSLAQPSLYAEAVYKPFAGTRFIPGLRVDYVSLLDFFTVDPRLSFFQQLGEKTLLKAAFGRYQQPPDFRAGQWMKEYGNLELGPERSLQAMVGAERKLTEALSVDLQLYYKWLDHLSIGSSRTVVRDGEPVLERWANAGEGRAYGAELLVRHQLSRNFFGWIAYSLSRSERLNTLWQHPQWTRHNFDQPHHLTVVASYKWPYDWITGLRLQVVSGSLTTPVLTSVYDADGDLHFGVSGDVNSERLPTFVSLDLRLDKRFVWDAWSLAVYLDVQNVTNNDNVETYLYNFDYTQRRPLRGLPIFPSLGIKAEF